MSNMSYCRFNNTLADLRDCRDAMREPLKPGDKWDSEHAKREQLLKLCIELALEYGVMDDNGVLTGEVQETSEWEESDDEDEG